MKRIIRVCIIAASLMGMAGPLFGGGLRVEGGNQPGKITLDNGSDLDVNGYVFLNGGIINCGSANIFAAGDWSNNGTFNCGSSTVTFDGLDVQNIITNSATYNHLMVTNACAAGIYFWDGFVTSRFTAVTASSAMYFTTTDTEVFEITADNGLTLDGQATGTHIVLGRSDGAGDDQWEIYPSHAAGNWSVDFVHPSNSVNTAENCINPTNSIDGGNTTNWFSQTLVDLVSLVAIGDFGKVLVRWETASEKNNAGFNIYRKEKGQSDEDYAMINGRLIPGLGNSAVGRQYDFWDYGVTDGTTYLYLLEDVEYTGRSTFHGPVEAHPGLDSDGDGITDDWENYLKSDPFDPDSRAPTEDWNEKIALVADDTDEAYEAIFEIISDSAAGYIPSGYDASKVYLNSYPNPLDCRQEIINKINEGCLVLNYVGHSNVKDWAHEKIFCSSDIGSLNNAGAYPFIVTMTCAGGYFVYPAGYDCMAESILFAEDKGAVACLMPSGTSNYSSQEMFDNALFEAVFGSDEAPSLGAVIAAAKLKVFEGAGEGAKNAINTYTLFGDPALELKILTDEETPLLSISPLSLDFSSVEFAAFKPIFIVNEGEGVLQWDITANEEWIDVYPEEGTTTDGRDVVNVTVDWSMLNKAKVHKGKVSISSNGGNENIEVNTYRCKDKDKDK